MPTTAVLGAKGGVGTSLLTTNLARAMARRASVILVDLHTTGACDDLLLDLPIERGWQHLLMVAHELSNEHLQRVLRQDTGGLMLLGSSGGLDDRLLGRLPPLLAALNGLTEWCLVDTTAIDRRLRQAACAAAQRVLLVTTPDPPALRCAARLKGELSGQKAELALIVNQLSRHHPASADAIAASLGLPLAAAVNRDPIGAGYQVNIGQQPLRERSGSLSEAGEQLAAWLAASLRTRGALPAGELR